MQRGEQLIVGVVEVLDMPVRDDEHVARVRRPPLRRDERGRAALAEHDVALAAALEVAAGDDPAERARVAGGLVRAHVTTVPRARDQRRAATTPDADTSPAPAPSFGTFPVRQDVMAGARSDREVSR